MRLWIASLAMTALCISASIAQNPTESQKPAAERTQIGRFPSKSTPSADTQEDVEIMRRLLARKLMPSDAIAANTEPLASLAYRNLAFGSAQPQQKNDTYSIWLRSPYSPSASAASIEGVYLTGKGVVFTVTLPAANRDPMPTTTTAAPTPISEWERARMQLRGENPEPATKTEASQPSTADVILKVLADNGKHLRIPEDEDVVVVVTFRGEATAIGYRYTDSLLGSLAGSTRRSQTPATISPQASGTEPTGPTSHGKSSQDLELLGDLHLRQRQYQSAIEAFEKAIAVEPTAEPKQMAENFRKLAEAKLQLGKLDEAKAMIESAVEWEKKSMQPVTHPETKTKVEARWPAKLIVTAKKQQLNEVGSGKLSMEEFRKKTSIELISPQPEK